MLNPDQKAPKTDPSIDNQVRQGIEAPETTGPSPSAGQAQPPLTNKQRLEQLKLQSQPSTPPPTSMTPEKEKEMQQKLEKMPAEKLEHFRKKYPHLFQQRATPKPPSPSGPSPS